MTSLHSLTARLDGLSLSSAARPVRFMGTGGVAGALQLLLLAFLTHNGWNPLLANGVAFGAAAQVNFVLSLTVTWRDRATERSLFHRWILFHGAIAFTALLNMLTFEAVRAARPPLAASAAGIALGAIGNYLASDRVVFRSAENQFTTATDRSFVA